MSAGWFAVKRGITSHPIFRGRPERLAIWIWLVDNAAWKDTQHDVKGKMVTVPRGSVCTSERRIADEVGVGYQVVRTFIKLLKKSSMINAELTHGRTMITLCNYDKYQSPQNQSNARSNAKLTQSQRTKEHVNNSDYVGGVENAAPTDPVKAMFEAGIRLLGEAGKSKEQARSLIGKWRKQSSDEAVMAALSRAQREGAIEPVSFIESALKFSAKKAEPQPGDTRVLKTGERQVFINPFDGWVRDHG